MKTRLSKGVVPHETGADYLRACVDLAEELNCRLGTSLAGELADCLRASDIFAHCFQGMGNTIVHEDGSIDPGVLRARERGVLFDAANGKGNFGLAVAQKALVAGFLPDIISTDLTVDKFNMPPYTKNLPVVLSKYLTLGMDLMSILERVTFRPAEVMGLSGKIGTLQPGAYADITILKEKSASYIHKDWKDDVLQGDVILVPQLTMCAGEIQYCQAAFYL